MNDLELWGLRTSYLGGADLKGSVLNESVLGDSGFRGSGLLELGGGPGGGGGYCVWFLEPGPSPLPAVKYDEFVLAGGSSPPGVPGANPAFLGTRIVLALAIPGKGPDLS